MFINTAPLRITLDDNIDFVTFIKEIAKFSLSMLRYQKYPYEKLLENLRKQDSNLPTLFDVMLSYQITKANDKNIDISYEVEWFGTSTISNGLCIHLHDNNDEENLNISYDYQVEKYDEIDIENMHERILYIINQVLENEKCLEQDLEIVTPNEKDIILNTFNNTNSLYHFENNIIEMIKNTANKYPNNIAIETASSYITYKDLMLRVNKLSNYLLNNQISENSNVGIFTTRTIDTIIGILSILNINCTYVPIDPEYPIDRINYMVQTSQINYILSEDSTCFDKIPNHNYLNTISINLKDYQNEESNFKKTYEYNINSNLYIVFTSGSTGKPKGVTISHKNMLNLIQFEKNETDILKCNNKILQFATMSFDVSYQEIYSSLLFGNTLVLIDDTTRKDMNQLSKYIYDKKINTLFIPPAYLKLLTENNDVNNLLISTVKNIITAGEPLVITNGIRELINAGITLHNHYGPAETHVATTHIINKDNILTSPPIGKPISNTNIHILDNNLKLCPIGTVGQIAISGDCVGNGYWNNPNLTNEKFLINPYNQKRMYLTGDLGFFDYDGIINFIGRADFQVKLNGFRVELQEIDEVLLNHPNIKTSVSIIHEENNKKYIITYFVETRKVTEEDLIKYLRNSLPFYMIPKKLVKMDSLPINNNGKIDKSKLPSVNLKNIEEEYIEPKTATEKQLSSIWKELFNSDKIGANYNFFHIGGDSLLAIKLSAIILSIFNISITVEELFNNPTIKELASIIDSKKNTNIEKIIPCGLKEAYHISSAQKRIYFSCKIAGKDNLLYNMPGCIIFDKDPDINRLNKCFEKLIAKHSSLRTYFEEINDEVYQKVTPKVSFKLEELIEDTKNVDEIMRNFVKPFDLSKAPLLRGSLVKNNNQYLLLFDIHHIICDGTSLSVFINELSDLYNGKNLIEIPTNYIDYAEWEFKQLQSDKFKSYKDFWVNDFKDDIPVLDLPTDYIRPNIQSFEGAKVYKTLDSNLFTEIHTLAKKLDVSTFMLLLSIYYVLLFKYSGQEDIVVGSPIAGRTNKELLNIIGMFVNTLPLKIHIDSNLSFKDFLKIVKDNCIKAFDNQLYPFDELVNNLNIIRDSSRQPLFDTTFIYQNNGFTKINFDNIVANMYIPDINISKFDLSLEIIPQDNDECCLNFEYCTKLFKKETIEKLANHFINIIKSIIEKPEEKIANICILSEQEKHKILNEFNDTKLDYPKDKTITQLFEEQAQKTPNNIAVVFEDKTITYKELNEKANNLAWHLRDIGLKRNDIVSIMVNRSLELLVAIIGVLKSGACYIPIDPNYPKDRTEYMLQSSNSKLLLTSASLYDNINFEHKEIVDLNDNYFSNINDNLPNINKPDDNSYIIYTSGSTGVPKGVVLKHKSLTNLAYHLNDYVCFLKNNNYISIASVTTASFDIFIFETLIALQKGLKVVVANEEEQRLPDKLNLFIKNNNIKAIQMTPSRMRIFVDNIQSCPHLSDLDYVVLAGEPLPDNLLQDLLALGIKKVYNGYGPSETTVFSTFTDVTNYKTVNIGRPLANTQMYILDKNLCPLPIGLSGELYIAGDGVGNGYLNNEKITKERFVPNPFNIGTLMYKTGDCCKFLDNGEIAYVERLDNQVKIRGLRIELEEIEAKMLEIPSIKRAKVVKQTMNKRDFISAYYISDTHLNVKYIRKTLSSSLPNYMVPSYFTQLDDFPYTPNGKIDKKALPLPNALENTINSSYVAPRTPTEFTLVEILKNILNVSRISVLDNFYNLGGDSLATISLCTNIRRKLNVELSFRDVMQNPIIEDLSNIIENAPRINSTLCSIAKCEKQDFYPTSSAQQRTYLASRMDNNSTLYNICGGILLDAMPDISRLQNALNIIIERHEALRTYFEIIDGQIMQKIKDNLVIQIDVQDVNTNNPYELFYIYETCFELSKAPLFNITLFRLPNGKILLMLDVHHIIFDGTSLNNLIQELSNIYNGGELPKLDISYKDFAVWENKQLHENGFNNSKKFWMEQFSSSVPTLNLPEVFPRPMVKNYSGTTYTTSISKELTEKINKFANKYNVTPYMVMLSSYYILLNKYSSNEDIVVGTPTSGRLYKELEPLLGMFVNSIPLRCNISPNMKFEELLQIVKTTCINAFAHQDYPFDALINDLKLPKDPSRSLLFDTMFIFQNNGIKTLDFGKINATYVPTKNTTSKFDISLEVVPQENELKLSFEYCTRLFDEIFIGNFAKAYERILTSILENPEILINNISITESDNQNKVVYKFNKIDLEKKEDITLFEKQLETPKFTFEENTSDIISNTNEQDDTIQISATNSNVFSSFTNINDYDTIEPKEIYSPNYIAPRTNIEMQIANTFENLLSIPHVGIDDNFFELGGDSLVAINLQIELLKSNLKLTYADIFSHPTVRTLSQKLENDKTINTNTSSTNEFSEINKILENNINMPVQINFKEIGNIFITGTTGFLGIHILENFLNTESGKAYCLIRPGKTVTPLEKLKEKLHYYFGEKYDSLIGNRIFIVDGDISKDNFGLSFEESEKIANNVTCIINSAAKVAHYGNYSDFEKINVNGTENLLKFCLKFNKRFYQISTLSVSGISTANQSFKNDVIFNESNLYINQSLDNVYVKSKFEAEKLVMSYILKGLDAYILRVRKFNESLY